MNIEYSCITPRQLLNHVVNTYGKITPKDLETNIKKLKEVYNISAPIKSLSEQVKKTVALADTVGQPYTDT